MKVFLVQFDIQWHDAEANFNRVRALLDQETIPPGSLIILPELFAVGFTMNVEVAAADEPTRTTSFLTELATTHRSCVIGGLATRDDSTGKGFNQLAAFGPDGTELTSYQKRRLFRYTNEDKSYLPGSSLSLFNFGGLKIQPLICYDLRFPELFREGVQSGAESFIVIANWPKTRHEHWTTLLRARAIENQAFVFACNRVGSDPALSYAGGSQIFDPQGKPRCPESSEEIILSAEINPTAVSQWRTEFPALADL
ncbi:MAG: nitrilase-related carbon-nitrogen hydrolase [Verrucomicrobiota bacterium]